MKKIATLVILFVFAVLLVACNRKPHLALAARISAIETAKYTAQTAEFRVTLTVGRKESPFIADGIVGTVAEYAKVEVIPAELGALSAPHTLTAGGKTYNLVRTANRYSLSAAIDAPPADLAVSLSVGAETFVFVLAPVATSLDTDKILRVAWAEFGDSLKDKTAEKEAVIRIVEDKDAEDGYNIYAGIIGSTAVYNAVLMSANYKVISKI